MTWTIEHLSHPLAAQIRALPPAENADQSDVGIAKDAMLLEASLTDRTPETSAQDLKKLSEIEKLLDRATKLADGLSACAKEELIEERGLNVEHLVGQTAVKFLLARRSLEDNIERVGRRKPGDRAEHIARHVAWVALHIYEQRTGLRASLGRDPQNQPSTPYAIFLDGIFGSLNVDADFRRAGEHAINRKHPKAH